MKKRIGLWMLLVMMVGALYGCGNKKALMGTWVSNEMGATMTVEFTSKEYIFNLGGMKSQTEYKLTSDTITLESTGVTYKYAIDGDQLTMTSPQGQDTVFMRMQ